jgi:hypothetical protein
MAMTTKTDRIQASLKKRIRQFYELLNAGDFARCHQMIDPRVRAKPSSVTLLQYENALRDFLVAVGQVDVARIDLDLHLNEPSKLYEDRDFAVGQTAWDDDQGESHVFQERWVREGRTWFTRATGLLAPIPALAVSKPGSSRPIAQSPRS